MLSATGNSCYTVHENEWCYSDMRKVRCFFHILQYVLSSGKDSLVKLWELSTARCLIAYTGAGTTGKQQHRSQAVFNHTEDYGRIKQIYGLHYAKRSLMSWVVVIPKEGWTGNLPHITVTWKGNLSILLLVWHRLFKFFFEKKNKFGGIFFF